MGEQTIKLKTLSFGCNGVSPQVHYSKTNWYVYGGNYIVEDIGDYYINLEEY